MRLNDDRKTRFVNIHNIEYYCIINDCLVIRFLNKHEEVFSYTKLQGHYAMVNLDLLNSDLKALDDALLPKILAPAIMITEYLP